MIIKTFQVKNLYPNKQSFFLLYGENEGLKKEITDKEIDLILYKFNNSNNSNIEVLSPDEKSKLKDDIDSAIEELDTLIINLKD